MEGPRSNPSPAGHETSRPMVESNVPLEQLITADPAPVQPILQSKGLAAHQNPGGGLSPTNAALGKTSSRAIRLLNALVAESGVNAESLQTSSTMSSVTGSELVRRAPNSAANVAVARDQSYAPLTKILGDALEQAFKNVAEMSSLLSRKRTTEQVRDKRKAEYDKSKPHHDKFPMMKESQTSAKEEAEKAYQEACHQVKLRNEYFQKLAVHTAEKVVPTILAHAGAGEEERQQTKDRMNALEKTCQNLQTSVQEQRLAMVSQLKDHQELRKQLFASEQNRLAAEKLLTQQCSNCQSQLDLEKHNITQITQKQNVLYEAVKPIQNISEKLDQLEKDMKEMIPANLKQRIQILDELPAEVKNSSAMSQNRSFEAEQVLEGQKSIHQNFQNLERKLAELEKKNVGPEINKLRGRINKIEKAARSVATTNVTAVHPAVDSGTKSLENRTQPMLQTNQKLQTSSSDSGEEISSLKKQFVLGLSNLESRFNDNLKSETELWTMMASDGLKGLVEEQVVAIKHRLNAIEEATTTLKYSQDTLKGEVKAFKDLHNSLKVEQNSLRVELDSLKAEHGSLKVGHDFLKVQVTASIDKQGGESLMAKNSLISTAAAEADRMLEDQNHIAPSSLVGSVKELKNKLNVLSTNVEAHSLAIGNLDSRFDNISTTDLHRAIMQSMHEQLPMIKDTQMTLSKLTSELEILKTNVSSVKARINGIEDSAASEPAAKAINDLATSIADESHKLDTKFAMTCKELHEAIETTQARVQAMEKSQLAARTAAGPSSRPMFTPIQPIRRPSTTPSEILGKRKLNGTGSASSSVNGGGSTSSHVNGSKTNGFARNSNSPIPKRPRRTAILGGGDDPEKDPSYEPDENDAAEFEE